MRCGGGGRKDTERSGDAEALYLNLLDVSDGEAREALHASREGEQRVRLGGAERILRGGAELVRVPPGR